MGSPPLAGLRGSSGAVGAMAFNYFRSILLSRLVPESAMMALFSASFMYSDRLMPFDLAIRCASALSQAGITMFNLSDLINIIVSYMFRLYNYTHVDTEII
jgi:hypothetical protein